MSNIIQKKHSKQRSLNFYHTSYKNVVNGQNEYEKYDTDVTIQITCWGILIGNIIRWMYEFLSYIGIQHVD